VTKLELKPPPLPKEILIGGVPGSYKTSLASRLCADLRMPGAGTDELRAVARSYDTDPFLSGKTHDRWQLLGDVEAFLLEGFLRQAEAMQPAVRAVRDYHRRRDENCLIEGVHIVPGLSDPSDGVMLIMALSSAETQLRRMISKRRQAPGMEPWTQSKADQSMRIQELLLENAARATGVVVLDADGDLDDCLRQAKEVIGAELL